MMGIAILLRHLLGMNGTLPQKMSQIHQFMLLWENIGVPEIFGVKGLRLRLGVPPEKLTRRNRFSP